MPSTTYYVIALPKAPRLFLEVSDGKPSWFTSELMRAHWWDDRDAAEQYLATHTKAIHAQQVTQGWLPFAPEIIPLTCTY